MPPDDDRDQMPPDPWADEGVDLWTLEQAEEYATCGLDPDHPRWDDLEGPTIDDFEDAQREIYSEQAEGSGLTGALRPWMGAIALLVIVALALTYGLRL